MSHSPAGPNSAAVSPVEAFSGAITRTKLSPLYLAGLTVVAIAMVLLPAIYFLLIGLTGWGVWFHLTHNYTILTSGGGGGLIKALVYLGPAIAGIILIFFMLKPWFAKKAVAAEPLALNEAEQPQLFAFVRRICELVRAPVPSRIHVDCQVNASASLRRGLWSREVILTIGLPLAAGLNLQQFAGVLAHEFGHFAQGAGMRLTYVIRSINSWFARVVYVRDEFDLKLDQTAKSVDIRLGVVLHLARGCVWLTRRVLWGLMIAGNAISCFMLRQMEFDADSYETKIAGSDTFVSTARRLRVLNVAAQLALEDVRQSWTAHRLPEDFPLLARHKAEHLAADLREKLDAGADTGKTGWFDTHPCDRDRNAAAQAWNCPGVFQSQAPAGSIFANFADLCRAATKHQYQEGFGLSFSDQDLVNSQEAVRESDATDEAAQVIRRFCGAVDMSLAPLLSPPGLLPVPDAQTAAARWRQACTECERLRPRAEEASKAINGLQKSLVNLKAAHGLCAVGFRVEPQAFDLPTTANSSGQQELAAHQAITANTQTIAAKMEEVNAFLTALRQRVSLALQMSGAPGAGDPRREEAAQAVALLVAVAAGIPALHQIGLRLEAFLALARNRNAHAQPAAVDRQLEQLQTELRHQLAKVQSPLGTVSYPYPHPRGALTIAEYARYESPSENPFEATYQDSRAHLERLFALHFRLLGRVLVMTEQAEKELRGPAPASSAA